MKFAEAMKMLEEGKKVRITSWPKTKFISLDKDNEIRDENNKCINIGTCFSYQWELYREQIQVKDIKEGELFEYGERMYRRAPSYMMEYAPVISNGFTIVAARHNQDGYVNGTLTVFMPNCLVYKL